MINHFVIRSRSVHRPRLFGLPERLLVALTVLIVGGAVTLLVMMLRSEQGQRQFQAQVLANRNQIQELRARVSEIESNARLALPTPESIRRSMVSFDQDILRDSTVGQSRVILEVNQLARAAGVNLAEVTFNPIEQKGDVNGQGRTVASQAVFPGMEMNFTVQGSYRNVRRFLAGLERSKSFIVINSLDLKSVEQSGSRGAAAAEASADRVIALGVNLSVYYSRDLHG